MSWAATGAVCAVVLALAYEDYVEYKADPFIAGTMAAGLTAGSGAQTVPFRAKEAVGASASEVAVPAVGPGFQGFPSDFVWGAATAAHQIEGAAAEGGRHPSVWDDLTHFGWNKAMGMHNADVACDHYHRFRDDVKIMVKLGLKAYRLSISWSRLIPKGEGEVNEEGARFYSDLFNELVAHGIEPWVTLFHWDLPSALNDEYRGFLGPKERIVTAFSKYARICFERFGDRVKNWMTLNEPHVFAMGYMPGIGWPARHRGGGRDPYTAAHSMLLCHAEAVRLYRTEFKSKQGGRIGVAINTDFSHPYDASNPSHVAAAQRANDFQLGWFADPIYFGDYPATMKITIGSRLPAFTPEESTLLKGSSDFFGLNNYFSQYAFPPPASPLGRLAFKVAARFFTLEGAYYADKEVRIREDPRWERIATGSGWPVVPWAHRDLLLHVQKRYNPPGGIVITENGCSHETWESKALDAEPGMLEPKPYRFGGSPAPLEDWDNETFPDPDRIRYLKAHLTAVHAARLNGVNITGYFLWSLLDNFEWFAGYRIRFGIIRVDYRTQKRTFKESARFYADVIRNSGFHAPVKTEEYSGAPLKRNVVGGIQAQGANEG